MWLVQDLNKAIDIVEWPLNIACGAFNGDNAVL